MGSLSLSRQRQGAPNLEAGNQAIGKADAGGRGGRSSSAMATEEDQEEGIWKSYYRVSTSSFVRRQVCESAGNDPLPRPQVDLAVDWLRRRVTLRGPTKVLTAQADGRQR